MVGVVGFSCSLLDINLLLALADPMHIHYQEASWQALMSEFPVMLPAVAAKRLTPHPIIFPAGLESLFRETHRQNHSLFSMSEDSGISAVKVAACRLSERLI
jgi:hypothetical protein